MEGGRASSCLGGNEGAEKREPKERGNGGVCFERCIGGSHVHSEGRAFWVGGKEQCISSL